MAASSRKKSSAAAKSTSSAGAAFQQYQVAVQLVQQSKYDKALAAFEKVLAAAPIELAERCRMYIATCQRQMRHSSLAFDSPAERFDYAVSQLNQGLFEEAREHLAALVADHPQVDYGYYGLAVLGSMTGAPQDCLDNLARAIELNPRNRLQARSDNDFQNMLDDPRFTELLYPEVP